VQKVPVGVLLPRYAVAAAPAAHQVDQAIEGSKVPADRGRQFPDGRGFCEVAGVAGDVGPGLCEVLHAFSVQVHGGDAESGAAEGRYDGGPGLAGGAGHHDRPGSVGSHHAASLRLLPPLGSPVIPAVDSMTFLIFFSSAS